MTLAQRTLAQLKRHGWLTIDQLAKRMRLPDARRPTLSATLVRLRKRELVTCRAALDMGTSMLANYEYAVAVDASMAARERLVLAGRRLAVVRAREARRLRMAAVEEHW